MSSKIVLEKDIKEKKAFIEELPLLCYEDLLSKAPHQKILGQKEEEYELILEKERVASVVAEHDELHPPRTIECPICLDTVKIRSYKNASSMFPCCGAEVCDNCAQQLSTKVSACPLCRGAITDDDIIYAERLDITAKRGNSWAQCEMGSAYMFGKFGCPTDMKEGMRFWQLAADQDDPEALIRISEIYLHKHEEFEHLVEKDEAKGMSMMQKAADKGMIGALIEVAAWYVYKSRGYGNKSSARGKVHGVYYATLAYAYICDQIRDGSEIPETKQRLGVLSSMLGQSFNCGWGDLEKSLHLAKHYFEISAKYEYIPSYADLGEVLFDLGRHVYGMNSIPGHSPMPKVFYWYRKAAQFGHTKEAVAEFGDILSQACAKCCVKAVNLSGKKLKSCARCKSVWYCGKKCQAQHWTLGHKFDCVKQDA